MDKTQTNGHEYHDEKISFKNINSAGITISVLINFPESFDEGKKYPAIVVTHPGGGVERQR